ncbi:MAG TPA: hypothetical protein VFP70_00710 [Burkholderiales bacterium]|nr:hypothetical protein [Burkholderiales bacterium]
MRNTDIFNLDFTTAQARTEFAVSDTLQAGFAEVEVAIGKLEEAIARGSGNAQAWRMLGALYIGTDRIRQLNELEEKHRALFGTTMFAIPQQRRVQRTPARRLFDMPARITRGSLPELEEVVEAGYLPDGAELDFSRVRGADAGGLEDLRDLFAGIPRANHRAHMLGIEPFINGLLKAAASPGGSRVMWEVLFAYLRLINNETAYASLASAFAAKFQTPAPGFGQ